MGFAHLHLHTEYSLLDGAMKFFQNSIGFSGSIKNHGAVDSIGVSGFRVFGVSDNSIKNHRLSPHDFSWTLFNFGGFV